MGVTSDYFLLYHGIHFDENEAELALALPVTEEENLKLFALFLTISRKAFDDFSSLPSFPKLCKTLNTPVPKGLKELYALQKEIIHLLTEHNSRTAYETLQKTFEVLMHEGLLNKQNYKKLVSLFTFQGSESEEEKQISAFSFLEEKKQLTESLHSLEAFMVEKKKAEEIRRFLNAQKFSVGITGVMNAGKSTMINALMGKEILGTSVIPETANLTLLQYAQEPSANVFYWNRREWEAIVSSSKELESMREYVTQTEQAFQGDLAKYILETSRMDEIALTQLPQYTSAAHSGKKCNLVKYVTLKTDLKYLQDGVEIVDTPGLDDPVIQREEITKQYISRCDMLLHLMNVSQSATQKDVEFIIDAVLYQNITKVLIVITRADTVSREALDEVIKYTRKAIEDALKVQNKESRLDYLLKTIHFIAISGKNALLCRTDVDKAKSLGMTVENTGMSALEAYLQENLFGASSQKSQLLIRAGRQKIRSLIEAERSRYKNELILASKSKEELEAQYVHFSAEKEKITEKIQSLKEDLNYEKTHLQELSEALDQFLSSEFYTLQTILRERVVSDVRYAYQTSKKIPESSRTEVIIQTAFKDGIIDIVRDYRYRLVKKFEEVSEQYGIKYKNAALPQAEFFDAETFFGDAFSRGFLTQNNSLFIQNIQDVIQRSKAKALPAMDMQIKEIVKVRFLPLEEEIREKLKQLTLVFIEKFVDSLEEPLLEEESFLVQEEKHLKAYIANDDKSESGDRTSVLEIHEKMKKLEKIEKDLLKGANDG